MQTSDVVLKLPLNASNREPDGSYVAQLQNPIKGSGQLFVALHELSLEFLPKNFTDEKNFLYYRTTGAEPWNTVAVGTTDFVDNIQLVLYIIQMRMPHGFRTKIKIEFNLKVNKVFVTLEQADVKFSSNLASVLGFKPGDVLLCNPGGVKTIHRASFIPNAMYRFEYLFLTCNFVSNSETPVGEMPLLRTIPVPMLDLSLNKRITIEFNELVYMPVVSNYFNTLRFKFFDSQFKEVVDFMDNDESA